MSGSLDLGMFFYYDKGDYILVKHKTYLLNSTNCGRSQTGLSC